jgi:recombination protein RecR
MNISSKLIQEAVGSFSALPGIGKRTALRLVLHLLNKESSLSVQLAESIKKMRLNIRFCSTCHNVSDEDICSICNSNSRIKSTICVVETIRDVMAIEDTGQYNGLYHVLGGVISPVDGIRPEDLYIQSLFDRIRGNPEINEIILAISPTIEGETTSYYISRNLEDDDVKISIIARGVSFGGELEYADELTLGRSILARTPYISNGHS